MVQIMDIFVLDGDVEEIMGGGIYFFVSKFGSNYEDLFLYEIILKRVFVFFLFFI